MTLLARATSASFTCSGTDTVNEPRKRPTRINELAPGDVLSLTSKLNRKYVG